VLKVIFPHAFVLSTINVLVDTSAVGLIVSPVAVINVSIYMNETTFTVSSVFTPFAAVLGSITPCLLAETVTESTLPLASVNCTSLESISWALLSRLIRVICVLGDCLTGFFLSEILAGAHLFRPKH
jgi:hypothetical protein